MMAARSVLTLLFATVPSVRGEALGCFWGGGHRCGMCVPDPEPGVPCAQVPQSSWCDPPSDYLDEVILFYDTDSMSDMDFCGAYMQVARSQPGDVTPQELDDIQTGVPALSSAITRVVYGVAGHEGVGKDCVSDVLQQGITGGDLQTCINEFIVTHGETALETAACEYISGGVLTPFCTSGLFKGALGVVNSFVNKYIEQPIVHAMDTIEDAVVGVAKKCANWFKGLFSLRAQLEMNATALYGNVV